MLNCAKTLFFSGKCVRILRKSHRSSKAATEHEFLLKMNMEAIWERAHIEHKEILWTAQFVLFVQEGCDVQAVLSGTERPLPSAVVVRISTVFGLDRLFRVSHVLLMSKVNY